MKRSFARPLRRWLQATGQGLLLAILLVGMVPAPPAPLQSGSAAPAAPSQPLPAQVQEAGPASPSAPASKPQPSTPNLSSAYIRDVDLGDGSHEATISTTPINYQAEDGSWQPIDARFQVVAGGFLNETNSLVIGAAPNKAMLRLRQGQSMVGWEPQALALTSPGGEETVLARPLEAAQAPTGTLGANGRTIRYEGGWSLSSLADVVTAGPGQVEESLIVGERPAGTGAVLALQADLYLLPGMQLYADGAVRHEAFQSAGPVEVRDAQGKTVLVLAPPRAFEQAHPGTSVAGAYRLAPGDQDSWQVAVETPWSWWSDPAREYPAVLDPTMFVLKAMDIADIYSAWPNGCSDPPVPPQQGEYEGATVGVGQTPDCGAMRALLRFNSLPTLPQGYVVEKAKLIVVPVRGYYTVMTVPGEGPLVFPAIVKASLYRILDGQSWDPSTVNWGNQPAVLPDPFLTKSDDTVGYFFLTPPSMVESGFAPYLGDTWILQTGSSGVVTDWLAGNNTGLELRGADESTCPTISFGGLDCHFAAIPKENIWTKQDKEAEFTPDQSTSGGVVLVIRYTAPVLSDKVPVIYFDPLLLPSTQGDTYMATYHSYQPVQSPTWMAAGVKGLDQVNQGGDNYYESAGNLGIGWLTGLSSYQVLSTGDYARQVNYLVNYNYMGTGSVEIAPPSLTDAANANLDTYMVESSVATPFTTGVMLPNTVYTQTIHVSSTHMLWVYDLPLAENTRVSVRVRGENAGALLFPPQPSTFQTKGQGVNGYPYLEIPPGQSGTWGLVVDYPGAVASPEYGPGPFNVDITIRVQACDMYAVPTENGCEIVNCPVAANCHTVGPFRICSDAGFDAGYNPGEWYSRIKAPNGTPYATCIGTAGSTDRWIAVDEQPIHFQETGSMFLQGTFNNLTSLASFSGGSLLHITPVWQDIFYGQMDVAQPDYGYLLPYSPEFCNYTGLPLDSIDKAAARVKINVAQNYATTSVTLTRPVETSPGVQETLSFMLQWQVQAEGYGSGPTYTLTTLGGPTQADISSLMLLFDSSWSIDFDTTLNQPYGRFTNLRDGAQIVQPDALGGAFRDIQVLILPYGKGLPAPDGEAPCLGYCLDPRAVDDTLAQPDRSWKMPDARVTDQARMLAYSSPGGLVVYSADHPHSTNDVGVPFSFDFMDSYVSVSKGYCPGDNSAQVTIVHGKTKMVIPGIGSDTAPPMIDAEFTLCETSLRHISMSIDSSGVGPGIPVGTTGIFIDQVGGYVDVAPDHTTVSISIHYKAGPTADILDSTSCQVTVDTRGLFDMQTSGNVLHAVGYYGHVWVAWNPLDVGVDVGVGLEFAIISITGRVYAHVWQGQGWQHHYSWLPDNSDMHLTGDFQASIEIKKGGILSEWWSPDIPPSNFSLGGFDIAFGQFCGEDCGCTCYEWGAQIIISGWYTLWQDIGVYYGFDSGIDFIFGSDGYTLIDQYKFDEATEPGPLIGGKRVRLAHLTTPDPLAPDVTMPITISSYASTAMIGLGWEDATGGPSFTLIRPDGQEISPTNASTYGITVTENAANRFYSIRDPLPGVWQGKVENAAPEDNWHLLFFASKGMPAASLLTPASPDEPWSAGTAYTIQWSVPPDLPPGVDVRMSLYYTVSNSGALTPTQQYGGMIAENLPIADGQYSWDTSYLADGTYHVYGRVGSGGSGQYLPRPTITGTAQLPGVLTVRAPGSILLDDTSLPQVPTNLSWTSLNEAAKVCWQVVPDHDLAGYVLRYHVPDVYGVIQERSLRVHAMVRYEPAGTAWQCARIGGLNNGVSVDVAISSYDASGNVSAYSGAVVGVASAGNRDWPPSVGDLGGYVVGSDHSLVITWTASPLPGPVAGYEIFYAPDWPAGPGQPGSGAQEGDSPINVGLLYSYTLHGLDPGRMYHVNVRPYDRDGRLGPITRDWWIWLSDGQDGNGDGPPDDWESHYGIIDPILDPDRDCLDSLTEYQFGSDPTRADTDRDGFSDGEEYMGGSDPRDPHSLPDLLAHLPRLHVFPTRLIFRAGVGSGDPPIQRANVVNVSTTPMTPTASASQPWLAAEIVPSWLGYQLRVQVKTAGLAPGHYSGVAMVLGEAGSCTQNSPQYVDVDLWLYQGLWAGYQLYLPIMSKSQ